uniref:Uncharacterized protein n=1 Tax=Chromera velia CCMP2878 TaxID=1169474 RepID=A0A0G4FAF6_9ALVE|eukprot:Cvel_3030.t1-p1 / transcript=Cvel_3030.t1 / gene=Cvel_3030 / organism=Chromera_velia_CCMP2878 / gene_product=hypothetical protein / transcript_product=hypothetical protein / location=Cvel_scaffold121:34543-35433(-) / protein_length=297 / sequence_SO=supercontig / SO=protein_coding / is_pseudo=false
MVDLRWTLLAALLSPLPNACTGKCYILTGTASMRSDWVVGSGACLNMELGCEHFDLDFPKTSVPGDATVVIYANSHGTPTSVHPHGGPGTGKPKFLSKDGTPVSARRLDTEENNRGVSAGIMGRVLAAQLAVRLPSTLQKLILLPCNIAQLSSEGEGFFMDFASTIAGLRKFPDLTVFGAIGPNVMDIRSEKPGHTLVFRPPGTNPDPYIYNERVSYRMKRLWKKISDDADAKTICKFVSEHADYFQKKLSGFLEFVPFDVYSHGIAKLHIQENETFRPESVQYVTDVDESADSDKV